jgi:hypothetical protein
LLATAVTIAAVAIPIRLIYVLALGPTVLLGTVRVFAFAISVVATAVPIPVALISGATIVMTISAFARGKATRHARG